MNALPRVSVILPTYNAGDDLQEAVASILSQTLPDLELIVVDDGSCDGSVESLLSSSLAQDARMRVLRDRNRGLAAALNRGLDAATAQLIARMDADDVALPHRLAVQVEFMDANPQVVLVGGQVERVMQHKLLNISSLPTDHSSILKQLLRGAHAMSHPTVVVRAEAVRHVGGYWDHGVSEDWDLYLKLAQFGHLANVSVPVLRYNYNFGSINSTQLATVRRNIGLAIVNYRRRETGWTELGPSEHLRSLTVLARLRLSREVASLQHYRQFLLCRAEGRQLLAWWHLGVCACLWPEQSVRRILSRLRR